LALDADEKLLGYYRLPPYGATSHLFLTSAIGKSTPLEPLLVFGYFLDEYKRRRQTGFESRVL
jgi:hypothetical protein